MSTLLNILIVEDSEDDTLLLLHELRRAGFEPEWKRVETEPDFLAELENAPDLILSDYSMPQFSGLRAVDCLRERGLDIPFILISGTIGEEAAVEAMKHGVTDYLLKDRLGRLGHAIERALDQKKLRDERNRMQQQLALQATALQTAANAINVTDRAGKILWINPAFTQATGYTAAEVLGQTPRVLKSGQHSGEFYRDFWKTILSGQTWRGEFINRRKDGSTYYDEHTVTPVRTNGGAITHFIGIMHDVTERKRAEQAWKQSEERFRTLVEDARDIVFTVASDRTITSLNTAFETITGFPRSEWIGREFQQLIHPDYLAAALDIFRRAMQNEKPPQFELRLRTKSGDFVTLEFIVTPQLQQGNVSGVMGIGRDVTERQRAELRAKVFSNLGQRLNSAKTPGEAASIVKDVADELLGWDAFTLDRYSPEMDHIYHVLNSDTVEGRRVDVPPTYDNAPPSPLARRVIESGAQLILRPAPEADTTGIPFGDTVRRSASLLFAPIRDGKRVVGILSIQSYKANAYGPKDLEVLQSLADHCSGALERIQATETMRESEARFRQLAENIHEVFWITDPAKNQILYVSPAYEAI
ncbi:MAG: PAS domain S-box protein [Verrucomicrobia bacterium]|nr:PAS domain S-box protein [Verrucomicrobiota bacterium]